MAAEESSAGVQFISGALAGLVSESVVHPIDTVRTRLQTQGPSKAASGGATSAAAAAVGLKESGAAAAGGQHYTGTGHALRTIMRQEGVRGLYGGFGPVCAFTVPAHGLYFIGYELAKARLQPGVSMEEKSVRRPSLTLKESYLLHDTTSHFPLHPRYVSYNQNPAL